jgi:uncharacterized protein involved in exopolysaccharide biosynthesis
LSVLNQKIDSVETEMGKAMISGAQDIDRGSLYIRSAPKVNQVRNQLQAQILGTMHAELIKNAELQKTLMAQQEPLFEIIDRPIYPLEKNKTSRLLSLVFGGVVGVFLGVVALLGKRGFTNMMSEE